MKNKYLAFIFVIASISLPMISNAAQVEEKTTPAPATVPAAGTNAVEAEEAEELKMFRFGLRMDKLDFVKKAMNLSGEQEKKFLDQYYKFDTEMKKLSDERLAIIKDYADHFENITDKEAGKLVKRSFKLRKQRLALLEKYYGKIAKATSKVIGARFLQVESILQGVGDVAIGSSIPLMPENQ